MDPSAPNGSSQQSKSQNGSTINSFYNGMQDFANFTGTPDDAQFDFMFDTNLYQSNEPPLFAQHAGAPDPGWNQPTLQQSTEPSLAHFGSMHSSFQAQPYTHPSFDTRQQAAQIYEPRAISRPSPSPSPYQNYAYQAPMNYAGRDPSLAPPQSFHAQQSISQQRSPSIQASTFSTPQPQNPYFGYTARQNHQPVLQNMELGNFANFPEPTSRATSHFIDPSYLTGHGIPNTQRDQYDVSQRIQQSQAPAVSTPPPVMSISGNSHDFASTAIKTNDSGTPQIQQPMLQSKFLAVDLSQQHGLAIQPKVAKLSAKPRKPKDPNAPKRAVGRPRKEGASARPRPDGKSPASSYDSDSDELEIEEMAEPAPLILSSGPPNDLEGKAIYDTIQAVWSPRNKAAVPDRIRAGIALFGETIRKLRDVWKTKNAALQQAENTNSTAVPSIKEEVARYRRLMEKVTRMAVEFGHEAHLTKLGENLWTLSAYHSVLLDRFNAGDYNGTLVTAILTLITKFKTVDQEMLETAKMTKILGRLTKKAEEQCRTLAQNILNNAALATTTKLGAVKLEGPPSPSSANGTTNTSRNLSPQVAGASSTGLVAGTKRPRDAEGTSLPFTKRTVVPTSSKPIIQASKPLALQAAERKRIDAAAALAKGSSSTMAATAASIPGRPKASTIVAAPKPTTSVFSSLISASKKPGTSLAARQAAAKDKVSIFTAAKKDSPPPGLQSAASKSSFSFMDTLADMSKPKEVEQKKVEDLPAETEEQRRKRLRKEERRKLRVSWRPDDSLVEVKIFTHDPDEENGQTDSMIRDVTDVGGEGRMLKLHKGLEELDDDEETQTQATGEHLEEYTFPSETDFGELEPESLSSNFIKFGGTQKPESAESLAQIEREQNSLMVVYSIPSDVPPTPTEPPASTDDEEYTPLTSFGEPAETIRSREATYLAARRAAAAPTPDLSAIIQQMKQGQQPTQQQAVISNLENTFGMFSQQPQQPQQQPDISRILAVIAQQQQFPNSVPATQSQATPSPSLAALLAQMQGQTQPAYAAAQPLGNPNPYPGLENDYSRKHARNDSSLEDQDRAWNKKKKAAASARTGPADVAAQSKTHPNFKTVICKFWQEGKCLKGDECTFRHDDG